jgi:hypothetical protein
MPQWLFRHFLACEYRVNHKWWGCYKSGHQSRGGRDVRNVKSRLRCICGALLVETVGQILASSDPNARSRTTTADSVLVVQIPLPERTHSLIWYCRRSINFLGSVQRIVNNHLDNRIVRVCWVTKILSHWLYEVFHTLHRTRRAKSPEPQTRKSSMTWKLHRPSLKEIRIMLIGKITIILYLGVTLVYLKVVNLPVGTFCGILLNLRQFIRRKRFCFRQQVIIIYRVTLGAVLLKAAGTHVGVTDKNLRATLTTTLI